MPPAVTTALNPAMPGATTETFMSHKLVGGGRAGTQEVAVHFSGTSYTTFKADCLPEK